MSPVPKDPPLRVREADGSPNFIPVYELVISGATLSRVGATGVQLLIDSGAGAAGAPTGSQYVVLALDATLTAERRLVAGTGLGLNDQGANSDAILSLVTPVSVSSGGTGVATLTAFGILYGSGGSAVQALAVLNSGELVVGSGTTTRPYTLPTGSEGQMLLTSGSVVGRVAWVNTGAGGGSGTVNTGSATYLAYYPSASTTVDDATLSISTGAGVAHFNVSILTDNAASIASGDVWFQSSSNAIYLMVRSATTTYGVQLTSV